MTSTAYDIRELEYSRISPDSGQPRKVFDRQALETLASSIKSEGLLQPITVRPCGEHDGFIIVAGERRWRAMGILGWDTVPAIIKEMEGHSIAKAQLLENAVRADLNPLEEARALKKANDEGVTIPELARALGWKQTAITWRIEMLDAAPNVLDLVERGSLNPYVAWHMGKLSQPGQMRALRVMNSNKLTNAQCHALCERIWSEEHQADMFPETILTQEQVDAVRTFGTAFETISKVLTRIERMHENNPQALRNAFAAEVGVVGARIDEAIKGMKRVREMVTLNELAELE